ncbi:coiled-coil domain-containing protein 78 [Cynoglossus semilaevis]|uniref:coiled-coil domain-containing protein 78 n=1 Tax=Cynoglossus semilaevis TaxID=244447 RepID=UPI0004961759|nr:coiled-coil domain-containing protein 78 [Cynoglossus semilaevis]
METNAQQATINEVQKKLQALTEENRQLCDRNERLIAKVGYLEGRLGHLASSNTDLSCRLIQSEEEKLKISKELVEEKLQTNRFREHFEEEKFELKNKILTKDSTIAELQLERDQLSRELQSVEARLKVGDKSGQELTEEFTSLKNSYLVLMDAHKKELANSENLSKELLTLAQAQDALRRQLEEQQQSVNTTTQGLHGELERVKALISNMSCNRVQPEDLAALDQEQKTLLGNQGEMKEMLQSLRDSYQEQQRKLEEKVAAMSRERQENRELIRNSQKRLSGQSAALLCYQNQVKEVEEQNSQLQLQVKELNEEYRARLVCYIQDLTLYVDGLGEGKSPAGTKMRTSVENMLQDVRSTYRVREEQLTSAARSYKKRLQKIARTHQALLIMYRVQREQILARPDTGLDPGPPEAEFSLEQSELRGDTETELQHLRQDKARLEMELQASREEMAALKVPFENTPSSQGTVRVQQMCEESWLDMRTQLRELTDSTLLDSEKERAALLSRAAVAEAQVSELQDYVNNHLSRYKQEIEHLRRLHRGKVAGPAHCTFITAVGKLNN